MRIRRSSFGVAARAVWALLAAVIAIGVVGVPAAHAAEGDIAEVGSYDLDFPEGFNSSVGGNYSLIFNSELRLAYHLIDMTDLRVIGRIIDLDSREVILEREIPFSELPGKLTLPATTGEEWIHAIDPEEGTLFVAYSSGAQWAGIAALNGRTLEVEQLMTKQIINFQVDPDNIGCTAQQCLPQLPTASPILRGISFVPPVLTGLQPKLLLLMEEPKVFGVERSVNVPWLAQWDVQSGAQDWIYRISSCANSTFPGRDKGRFQLGVFQARLGTGIYVGCSAAGGTGQIVWVQTDGTNTPQNAELAFPGPQGVVDIIPDPLSDRMLLNIDNEDGLSWWVFDGPSRSYSGIVGATVAPALRAAGLDPVAGRLYMVTPPTAKGRLSTSGGLLISDIRRSPAPQFLAFEEFKQRGAGIIRVDVDPTSSQRLVWFRAEGSHTFQIVQDNIPISFDEPLSELDQLTVDVEEEEGVTGRNFQGTGHAYGVRALAIGGLEGVPPTGPDISGVRVGRQAGLVLGSPCGQGDREMVIAAIKSATLSNNLSSAQATVGDADAGTKTDLGEPTGRCYPRPKDTTGRDIWTTQHPPLFQSPKDLFGDYPQPHRTELDDRETGAEENGDAKTDLDELAGSSWPFTGTECAGEGTDSTFAKPRPLDRGDPENGPIPAEQRETEVELERMKASVVCQQSKNRVLGQAQLLLADAEADADEHEPDEPAFEVEIPDFGTIRVGEISSSVEIFIDPERGLVSRSTATARHISIGDDIFIDTAYTLAEAQAAGRFGTAATTFERRLCGVRVADQAPDTPVHEPAVDLQQLTGLNPSAIQRGEVDDIGSPDPDPSGIEPQGGSEREKNVDVQGCSDDPVHTQASAAPTMVNLINRVLGTRGQARVPRPDGELSQGTPGGYLASIQKDRLEEISSRAVNNDPSTQVPALEIIIFNDDPNQGRARQVYQFAGVDASVTYGIFLLNPEFEFDLPDLPPTSDLPAIDPFDPPPPPPTSNGGTTPPPRQGPITILYEGVNFLLRSPFHTVLAAGVWALLFAPIQLASRRRALRLVAMGR